MKAIDWTKIYKNYKGKWVALKDDEQTIVASGNSLEEIMEKSKKKGLLHPVVTQVPREILPIVGII